MRYYCESCKTEFKFHKDVWRESAWDDDICPVCKNPNYKLIGIPDYETLAQYEKRTGNKFPDNGAVWVGTIMREDWINQYCVEWTALSLDQLACSVLTSFSALII